MTLAATAKFIAKNGDKVFPVLETVIKEVTGRLDGTHTIVLEVDNLTGYVLEMRKAYFSSGRWQDDPDSVIPSETISVFSAENKDGAIGTGAIGCVLFEIMESPTAESESPDDLTTTELWLACYFSNPSIGGYKANGYVLRPKKVKGHPNAETWYDKLSSSGGDNPYTEGTDSRSNHGFSVTYSAGHTAKFALHHNH